MPAVVVGDFNIHYDEPSKAEKVIGLLDTFGLIQHVTTPTLAVDQSVASVRVKPMSIADHHCIDCVLAMRRPSRPPVNVHVRDFRQLQIEHFRDDIAYLPTNGP